jgi:hypothetical protein
MQRSGKFRSAPTPALIFPLPYADAPNLYFFYHLILKNFWNHILTYFEDFRLHTLSLSYFSFIDMQMSGIYVTYEWWLIKECKVQLNIMK